MTTVHRTSLATRLRLALRAFFTKLERVELAIVLSEAGDVDGARGLLKKPDQGKPGPSGGH